MRYAILGPLEVRDIAAPDHVVRLSPKLSGLLAVLLCAPGSAVAEARLIEAMWDGAPPRSAQKSLHVYVHHLRQSLGGPDTVVREGGGYRLAADPAAVDSVRFARLVEEGRGAIGRGESAVGAALLREALDLWRGPAFSGLDSLPLVREEAARLAERRWSATEELFRTELALGRHDDAVAELTALVAEHPFRERLRGTLMLALYRAGRTHEALEVYRSGRALLIEELGIEPGRELRDLETAVLRGDPALDAPPAPDPTLAPAPEADPQDGAAPAAQRPPPVPAQLPPDIADFTGREALLAELGAALGDAGGGRTGGAPVAAISGMGGVGKTSLAVRVAHSRAADYPGGQLYVDLRGAEDPVDPAQVLAGFLHALGVEGAAVPVPQDERSALFRSMLGERRMLVVLDDAASEAQVRPLLPAAGGSAVLVTSRTRLVGLEGARLIDLDVFEPGQAIRLLERILGADRVAADPDAAESIARLCGYAPLAVRIAGARLAGRRQWPLSRLVRMLAHEGRRLDVLAVGDREVRACIELSHRALDPDAREAFRLLGVVEAPDYPEWVVAALLDVPMDAAQEHIEALVDAQLLTIVGGASGRLRYRMHDLIRLYARELGAGDERGPAALRRAIGGWLWLAEQATEYIPGPCYATMHGTAQRWPLPSEDAAEALSDPMSWFDDEWHAMAAVVRQAGAAGLDEAAWDLAGCLEKYFDVRGRFDDWLRCHETALAACRAAGNVRGEAVLRRGMADLNTWIGPGERGDFAMIGMLEQADRVFEMFAGLGDLRGMSDALVMRTWGLVSQGLPRAAGETSGEALRLAEEADYLGGRARAYHVMAIADHEQQRTDNAVVHLTEAMKLARLLGNSRFEATAMQFLGAAECLEGDIETGRRHLLRSLEMTRAMGDRYGEVFSLMYLARLYIALGDPEALPAVEAATGLSRRHRMNHHLADSLALTGQVHLAAGDVATATGALEESVALWRTRGWPSFLADTLDTLARAHDAADRHDAAAAARAEAAHLRAELSPTDPL
ncbi:DNA-binding SARP family transcriptional activator [Murinocardiopsis flavida]|uniref:DNA-binding SARP family transcriptional activator n=1 Tax=Murinocardiopsis flavida TaxID=645275 RepID=A0A2P8DF92_9ACTN|nr:AfsR/SARP family transcriptional regulator [Murinocardiopsis flavida]PSK95880.1 DNA-binding SARP family transcriptional activator [Murinocardiopsis flavida]